MPAVLVDLGRLIILILFLPLILMAIGPLLVLTVIRGQQRVGPITLDASRYSFMARAGIAMLGLAIWLLVWSGFVWLALAAISPPPPVVVQIPTATLSPQPATATPSPPTATPTTVVTPTPIPPTSTPTNVPTIPPPTNTPTSLPTLTPTPILRLPETPATNTPTPELYLTPSTPAAEAGETPRPTLPLTLTVVEQQVAIAVVKEGNALLRGATSLANEENLQNLETVWRDQALVTVQKFATELYDRYRKPFVVDFEYITPPTISSQTFADRLVVTSQEKWSYGGPATVDQEAFEFIYTLVREGEQWHIIYYSYRNLPLPAPTIILQEGFSTVAPPSASEN